MHKQDHNWIESLYNLVVWGYTYPRSIIIYLYHGIFRLLNLYRGFKTDHTGKLIKYTGKGGHVKIPEGVTSIGDQSFYGCTSLAFIIIPDSVMIIGDNTITDCTSLASVEIPDCVTSIGESAFD